jgi:hypothetical protein
MSKKRNSRPARTGFSDQRWQALLGCDVARSPQVSGHSHHAGLRDLKKLRSCYHI